MRGRGWSTRCPGTVFAVAAAGLVQYYAIRGSLHEHGRSLAEVGRYSADWIGFLSRHGSGETFVFLGWLTPLLALVGLVLLLRDRRYALAALLAAAVVVPVVIALGTHLPTYSLARHVVPGLKVARVPERLLPLACLALAALLAFALARARPWLVAVALVLVAADLHVRIYHAARADEGNAAYAALRRSASRDACSSCPSSCPDVQLNSTYLYYDMAAQRQRPAGYSTTVPRPAFRTARRLRPLTCGTWSRDVARLGIRYVAVHDGFYERYYPHCLARARGGVARSRVPSARPGRAGDGLDQRP